MNSQQNIPCMITRNYTTGYMYRYMKITWIVHNNYMTCYTACYMHDYMTHYMFLHDCCLILCMLITWYVTGFLHHALHDSLHDITFNYMFVITCWLRWLHRFYMCSYMTVTGCMTNYMMHYSILHDLLHGITWNYMAVLEGKIAGGVQKECCWTNAWPSFSVCFTYLVIPPSYK